VLALRLQNEQAFPLSSAPLATAISLLLDVALHAFPVRTMALHALPLPLRKCEASLLEHLHRLRELLLLLDALLSCVFKGAPFGRSSSPSLFPTRVDGRCATPPTLLCI
jgi:hypothetical protein